MFYEHFEVVPKLLIADHHCSRELFIEVFVYGRLGTLFKVSPVLENVKNVPSGQLKSNA